MDLAVTLLRSLSPIYKMPTELGGHWPGKQWETKAWPGPVAGYRVAAARFLSAMSESLASQPPCGHKHPWENWETPVGSTPGNLESTPSEVDSAWPAGDGSSPGAAF